MKNLKNMRFGRWLVLELDSYYKPKGTRGKGHDMWLCRCDCGNQKVVAGRSLVGGCSKSCGCLQKELASKRASKHGGFGTRLYNVWDSMRQRCNNHNDTAYHNYGGRGISVCPEWDEFSVFRQWALESGYKEEAKQGECTLDRKDVNKNYSPDNCKWVSMKEQSNNKRNTIYLEYGGEIKPLTSWAEELGIKYQTIWRRYKRGWLPEKILGQTI